MTVRGAAVDSAPGPRPSEEDSLRLILPGGGVPLGFVRQGDEVFLVARDRGARWPVEVLRSGSATLSIGGRSEPGAAELLVDPSEKLRVLESFRQKYGDRRYERWYRDPARVLKVRLGRAGVPSGGSAGYYRWLTAEFDNVADEYDRHILGNRINRLLRDRSLSQLRATFAGDRRLLEIGCGSGMETLPLLGEGHEVFCVDVSDRMLDVVREKARRAGVLERLETRRLTAASLPDLLADPGPGAFDGAYSTYGALNCEADLRPIPPALHALIRPEGRFVAGVYNRWCVFELVGYSLTGQFGRAWGRTGRPVRVGSSRFCIDVFAHSAAGFAEAFSPWFVRERVEGVPVLLPPSDLVGYADRSGDGFERWARWDRYLGSRWPFRLLGDHFLMTLRRADSVSRRPSVELPLPYEMRRSRTDPAEPGASGRAQGV